MSGRNQVERSIASKRAGMSEKPIYASTGIVVTPQMVTIKGQSYAVRQIAGVSCRTYRKTWMKRLLLGLAALSPISLILLSEIGFDRGAWTNSPQLYQIVNVMAVISGLAGLFFAVWGGVPLLYGLLNSKAGNYLELSTADGRRNEIWGLKPSVTRDLKSAIEQAIVLNGRVGA
ncbi:MAG: DUF6232 family protein [Hyphomicrobium sp.]